MKLTGFALACAAVLSACTAAPVPEYTNDVPHSIPLNGHVRLLEEVSEIRRAQGLSIVASSAGADQAAHRAAADMARHGTFSHTGSDGSSAAERLRDAGCSHGLAENIAKGNALNSGNIIQTWMDSPGHRENILRSEMLWMGIAKVDDVWVMTLAERC
ncbi:hypothetical protein LCGC14_0044350 [marine sediment metagenome]|uniref:CAP domain-containing protein n=2 Tax=root TaxID=1 RepID=A0A7V1BJ35_9RHOB|nr:CAP domain-containing protein [Sulfitobacter litoralis]HDZ53485.1 CAP domain-containing protein [Sulfitobacter litoralis]